MTQQQQKKTLKDNFSFRYSFEIEHLKQDWLVASGGNVYLSISYLKALEQSVLTDVTFIYVVVYKGEKSLGVIYFQWIHIGKDFFTQDKFPNEIHSNITSGVLKNIKGSLLLCGNFFATGVNGYYFSPEIPSSTLMLTVKKIKKQLCKAKGVSNFKFVMFKEFCITSNLKIQEELVEKSAKFQIDVNMVLKMDASWKSFEDYISVMTTKYRTRAKSVYKKTSQITAKEFLVEDINRYKKEIEELYGSVLKTASFNMVQLSVEAFYHLKKELKKEFIFTGYFKEDQLIAFSTACVNDTYLDANYVGIDYVLNKQIPVYQRVLYDYVKLALSKRVTELRLGRTAETIKSALGAVPIEMNLYVKHTNPVIHTLLKPLIRYVKPSSYQIRKPFKNSLDS